MFEKGFNLDYTLYRFEKDFNLDYILYRQTINYYLIGLIQSLHYYHSFILQKILVLLG